MYQTQINITENVHKRLLLLSKTLGKQVDDIINMAILEFNPEHKEKNRLELLRKARGLWKGRKDLKSLAEMRDNWERTIS